MFCSAAMVSGMPLVLGLKNGSLWLFPQIGGLLLGCPHHKMSSILKFILYWSPCLFLKLPYTRYKIPHTLYHIYTICSISSLHQAVFIPFFRKVLRAHCDHQVAKLEAAPSWSRMSCRLILTTPNPIIMYRAPRDRLSCICGGIFS